MKQNFAKLFERDGKQVVVMKARNSDGDPSVSVNFQTNSGLALGEMHLGFSDSAKRDKAYESIDADLAFAIREDAPGVKM